MNLLEIAAANQLVKTGEKKKLSVPGQKDDNYEVYKIPLEYLYYNDQNGRINTLYKKYISNYGSLTPERGKSEYNKIFESFIYESHKQSMKDTKQSIMEKFQQEPGVVLPDGRVIDGNRRFTALRMIERETGITQEFNAVILKLDLNSKIDEKIIKELELDLQLGREERVNYDPIDRIFDVYHTIEVEKIMTKEEYKKASGAKNTRGINRDIRLAELIIKFIEIVSPGGNPIEKFYLARDLKLDGPIEEIEGTLTKLKSKNKETIKEAVLVYLAASKTEQSQQDTTRVIRDLKNNVLQNDETIQYFVNAVDDKVDIIIESFEDNPIKSANDLKDVIEQNEETQKSVNSLIRSTNNLIHKGKNDNERTKSLVDLEMIRDSLLEIRADDFLELTVDENLIARDVLREMTDILYKLKKEIR